MAKVKSVRQAYPVTLVVTGREVTAGTAVSLPQDEAERIASLFGTVPEDRSLTELPDGAKSTGSKPADPETGNETGRHQTGEPVTPVDPDQLKAEFEAAQLAYDSAKAALGEPNAGDAELAAFEAAEERLNAAEAALEDAGGQ